MNTQLKTFLVAAGTAVAASMAQANTIPAGYSDYESGAITLNNTGIVAPTSPATITEDYEVGFDALAPAGQKYIYTYTIPTAGVTLDSVTVRTINLTSSLGINGINSPGVFTGAENPSNVSWTSANDASVSGLQYQFYSPYGPVTGKVSDQDDGTYVSPPGIPVPGFTTPDGGLTVSLLGGALLGIAALRRKLGC